MVRVTYKDVDGTESVVDAVEGVSVMETAVRNGVVAIEGECGGALACATCHVHIPDEWRAVTGEASDDEREMLEFGVEVDERSRLSCQIHVTAAMEGITILTPRSQR
ncbi:MAG: 2Fe-2S ferredoxin [Sphingomonas bacterium]|uniref:2Fe-2S iron-sulfur cluster-binding protein n=1 Tax=Sphingomonas bacterium TaxID=1895847 RepID=UPI00260525ED|nr:2Fe-2S iron-sulfur cluster-binding protein [Sphingomonas bacterium]MDB5703256.1 2Fe-2S ferredoxin [Sphingomonas bacterium]